jgi:hypothetical protein
LRYFGVRIIFQNGGGGLSAVPREVEKVLTMIVQIVFTVSTERIPFFWAFEKDLWLESTAKYAGRERAEPGA